MRELTFDDMDQTSGGVVPIIALVVQVGSMVARGYAARALAGAGTGMAISDVQDYFAE